jgi:ATP-binding cassette subfamily B protein
MLGVISLIRGVPCETVIASSEVLALTLPSYTFLNLLNEYPEFGGEVRDRVYAIEAFDLVAEHAKTHALDVGNLRAKAQTVRDESAIVTLPTGDNNLAQLDRALTWVLSGGTVLNLPVGSTLALDRPVEVLSPQGARVLGMTPAVLAETLPEPAELEPEAVARSVEVLDVNNIPYATEADLVPRAQASSALEKSPSRSYPLCAGSG